MKKYRLLKLLGLALATMVTLVAISVIEVTIYSYFIKPGQQQAFYDEHANLSAPWISGIFGFIVFFSVVRHWCRKKYDDLLQLAVLFVLTYIVLDIIILFAFQVNWNEIYPIFLIANGAKLMGALTAYFFYKPVGNEPAKQ